MAELGMPSSTGGLRVVYQAVPPDWK